MIKISFRQFAESFQTFNQNEFKAGEPINFTYSGMGDMMTAKLLAAAVDGGGKFVDLTISLDNDCFPYMKIMPFTKRSGRSS